MDEYGCYRNTKKDWDELADILFKKRIVSFSYFPDGVTTHILTIAGPIIQTGTMSWGGQLDGCYLVALRLRGSNYFDLVSGTLHADYITEKLGLAKGDALEISELMREIGARLKKEFIQRSRELFSVQLNYSDKEEV